MGSIVLPSEERRFTQKRRHNSEKRGDKIYKRKTVHSIKFGRKWMFVKENRQQYVYSKWCNKHRTLL